MDIAQAIIMALQVWGIIGAVVASAFLTVGIDRIDEDARGAYVLRPLLIPGVLRIWPLVRWRWCRIETQAAPGPRVTGPYAPATASPSSR